MGTSASNNGPKGSPPLLPDWYNDDATPPTPVPPENNDQAPEDSPESNPNEDQPNEQPVNQPSKDWGKSKGALTRVANKTSGSSHSKAAANYIGSLGGARSAAKAAAQGIKTGNRFAGFLSLLSSNGSRSTLANLGLGEYVGRSSEEICAAIANALSPIGATNDEAIARDALITTLDALYTKLLEADGSVEALDNLTPELIKETLIEYVGNFIFSKWMYELGTAIERGDISEQDAINLEKDVKDLIVLETTERYRDISIDQFNLNDSNNIRLITDIFETAYSTLES